MTRSKIHAIRLNEVDNNDALKMCAIRGEASVGEMTKKLMLREVEKYRNANELSIARYTNDLSMQNNNLNFQESKLERQASLSLLRDQNNFIRNEAFPNGEVLSILRGQRRDMSVGLAENFGSDLVGIDTDASRYRIIKEHTLQELEIEIQQHDGQSLTIPTITGEGGGSWVSIENDGVNESTPGTGKLELKPKFANSHIEATRHLLLSTGQSAHDKIIEAVSADVYDVLVDGLFNGTGSDGQPEGLNYNSSVQTIDGSSFTLAKSISIIKASHNSKYSANKKWVMNFNTFSTLSARDVGTDTGQMIIQTVNARPFISLYPIVFSSKVADNQIFFGDFSANCHLVVFGSALDLFVKKMPITGIRSFDVSLPVDFAFQNPASFIKCSIT